MRWNNKTGLIGVDIGTQAVKLAQVERQAQGYALRETAVIVRRDPWEADDWQTAAPRSSIDEIMACRSLGSGFAGRSAACTLPMAVCDVRSLNVRAGDARQQTAVIAGELRSIWGDGNPFAFDSWSIPPIGPSFQDNVNVVSTQLGWSDRVAIDHRQSKLACRVMDGLPLALARAVRLATDDKNTSLVAALDWGYTRATFCLICDGNPIFVRCFREAGLRRLIDSLCSSLGISAAESQHVLEKYGLPDAGSSGRAKKGADPLAASDVEIQQLIADVAAEAVDRVGAELKRTLLFVKSHLRGQLPNRIFLFGGGASVKRSDKALTEQIELPVTVWQPKLQLGSQPAAGNCPLSLFGPAIALSMLAWE